MAHPCAALRASPPQGGNAVRPGEAGSAALWALVRSPYMNPLFRCVFFSLVCFSGLAGAQLSSPLGAAPASKPSPEAGSGATPAVPHVAGQGPGVHSPLSPFAPLAARADVVAWS